MTHDEIAALIPHAGAMCLLDSVLTWDTTSITCVSGRYLALSNPLRRADGRLGAATGIELAGQAAALHGRLTAPTSEKPRFGYLASLRDIQLATAILDTTSPLTITAERLMGDATGATYNFALTQNAAPVLSGRFTVLFGPDS
jgi:predicted hotdog family 3-hydroxylacyl-ACP dehydratase